MKILQVINSLGSGGAEKLLETMVPILNTYENVECDILLLTDKNNVFHKSLLKNGVKIDVIPIRNIRSFGNILYLIRYIISGKYDIVHSHLPPCAYWVGIVKMLLRTNRIKFLTTIHTGLIPKEGRPSFRPLYKKIYSSYDAIICIIDYVKSCMVEWIKPRKSELDKYIVINNGVDLNKFNEALPYKKSEINNNFTKDTKLVCIVGRLSASKDQKTLIEAMKYLEDEVNLLIVGEGQLKESYIKFAREIDVSDRVHFLGFRNDVERILKTVDIGVMTSRFEAFGLAALEMMASGIPLVASNIPGLKSVVEGHGLLFETGNSKELADIINCLLKDDKFYNEVAEKGLKRSTDFSVGVMVEQMVDVYRKLLKDK